MTEPKVINLTKVAPNGKVSRITVTDTNGNYNTSPTNGQSIMGFDKNDKVTVVGDISVFTPAEIKKALLGNYSNADSRKANELGLTKTNLEFKEGAISGDTSKPFALEDLEKAVSCDPTLKVDETALKAEAATSQTAQSGDWQFAASAIAPTNTSAPYVDPSFQYSSQGLMSTLSSFFSGALGTGGAVFPGQSMGSMVQQIWNSIPIQYPPNPFTNNASATTSTQDGTTSCEADGYLDDGLDGGAVVSEGVIADDVVKTKEEIAAEKKEAETAKAAEIKKAAEAAQVAEAKKAIIEKQQQETAATKLENAKICKELYLAMKGFGTDDEKLKTTILEKINKGNVVEILDQWNKNYKNLMDGDSLIESIVSEEDYDFNLSDRNKNGLKSYTNHIKDALKDRAVDLKLIDEAMVFDAVVTKENSTMVSSTYTSARISNAVNQMFEQIKNVPPVADEAITSSKSKVEGTVYQNGEEVITNKAGTLKKYTDHNGNRIIEVYKNGKLVQVDTYPKK